jgi:hypothetical protein
MIAAPDHPRRYSRFLPSEDLVAGNLRLHCSTSANHGLLAAMSTPTQSGRGRSIRCLTARRPNNLGADCSTAAPGFLYERAHFALLKYWPRFSSEGRRSSVRNQDGSRGGLFVGYEAARRFVNTESARHQRTGKTHSATANALFARTIEGRRRDCELFGSDSARVSFTTPGETDEGQVRFASWEEASRAGRLALRQFASEE